MDVSFSAKFFYPLVLIALAVILLPFGGEVKKWTGIIVGCVCALYGAILAIRMITVSG